MDQMRIGAAKVIKIVSKISGIFFFGYVIFLADNECDTEK